jgi:hypothetical protein
MGGLADMRIGELVYEAKGCSLHFPRSPMDTANSPKFEGCGLQITCSAPSVPLRNDRKWRIVLKKSFFAMTENSQDRRCVLLAAT